MRDVIEINIKQDYPPSDVATGILAIEIERERINKTKVIKVITGYGSHGKGGKIKEESILLLQNMKKTGKIIDFLKGEQFGINEKTKHFTNVCPSLILDSELKNNNSGIILVLLNE